MKTIMNKRGHHTENGFTLVEVMLTVALITIGVMAVAKMQVFALKADRVAYNQTEAAMYAANKAEQLINIPLANDTNNDLTVGDHGPDYLDQNNKYELNWNVQLAPSDTTNNTRVIQLVVSWEDQGGQKEMNFAYVKTATF